MAAKHSRHIAVTEPAIAGLEDRGGTGECTSVRTVVRTVLRHRIERDTAKAAYRAVAVASSVAVNDRA